MSLVLTNITFIGSSDLIRHSFKPAHSGCVTLTIVIALVQVYDFLKNITTEDKEQNCAGNVEMDDLLNAAQFQIAVERGFSLKTPFNRAFQKTFVKHLAVDAKSQVNLSKMRDQVF